MGSFNLNAVRLTREQGLPNLMYTNLFAIYYMLNFHMYTSHHTSGYSFIASPSTLFFREFQHIFTSKGKFSRQQGDPTF